MSGMPSPNNDERIKQLETKVENLTFVAKQLLSISKQHDEVLEEIQKGFELLATVFEGETDG